MNILIIVMVILILIASGLPLVLYPGVMLGNIMGLAAMGNDCPGDHILKIVVLLFIFLSSVYPAPYIYAVLKVWACLKLDDVSNALMYSLVPVFWLFLIALAMYGWRALE